MSFWNKIFGKNAKDRQIIKEPANEIIKATPNELMAQEELNNNNIKDKALNNKDSP
ncbi:MAG: hypothetical protein Q8O32_00825 [bacterium]|nr:hypothetical protein [bacterium]